MGLGCECSSWAWNLEDIIENRTHHPRCKKGRDPLVQEADDFCQDHRLLEGVGMSPDLWDTWYEVMADFVRNQKA